jgi:hypothetical protein
MPVKTNISMSQVHEMHELYQRGAMMKDVGKRFGISESRVSTLFKRAGLQSRHLGKIPTAAEYEQYARASKGASPSPATVSKRCGTWTDAIRMAGL